MAPKVQKDANGNTICRRDSQGRKIACARCIKGHRTSMCKPSHTEGVQVIDGVGRKQGTKNGRRNDRSAAYRAESFLQQASQQPLGSNDGNGSASLQSLPQMQGAYPSGESTPQYAQGLEFPLQVQPQPNWVAPVAGTGFPVLQMQEALPSGESTPQFQQEPQFPTQPQPQPNWAAPMASTRVPVPQMQANLPAGDFEAAPAQQQQGEMAQQLAELGVRYDPMHQMQAYQHFGHLEADYTQLMQMQEHQPPADILGRGFMAEGQWASQHLDQSSGVAMNSVPLHQNMAPSQHPVPAQAPIGFWNLADPDEFKKRFPMTPETQAWIMSSIQELRREKGLQ